MFAGVIAEQQRAKQPFALVEQAIDQGGAAVSLFLQPRHAGARGRRQRRLAAGEERRQQQADEDDDEGQPVVSGHGWESLSLRKARTSAASTSFSTKAWPMPRTRMKVSSPRLTFLSCAISVHQCSSGGTPPRTSLAASAGRPPQMRAGARRLGLRQQAAPGGKFEGQRHAERDRLAVQQPVGETGAGFQRMAEGVAEIEQRALAGFALVARRRCRLAAAADGDGVLARAASPPAEHVAPIRLQPGEEGRRRRAARIWRLRHSRRGTRARAAYRAARCRRPPESADGRRRPGSCRGAN